MACIVPRKDGLSRRIKAARAAEGLLAAIAKATTVATSLKNYNLTLNVPQPVKAPETAPARRPTNGPRG